MLRGAIFALAASRRNQCAKGNPADTARGTVADVEGEPQLGVIRKRPARSRICRSPRRNKALLRAVPALVDPSGVDLHDLAARVLRDVVFSLDENDSTVVEFAFTASAASIGHAYAPHARMDPRWVKVAELVIVAGQPLRAQAKRMVDVAAEPGLASLGDPTPLRPLLRESGRVSPRRCYDPAGSTRDEMTTSRAVGTPGFS